MNMNRIGDGDGDGVNGDGISGNGVNGNPGHALDGSMKANGSTGDYIPAPDAIKVYGQHQRPEHPHHHHHHHHHHHAGGGSRKKTSKHRLPSDSKLKNATGGGSFMNRLCRGSEPDIALRGMPSMHTVYSRHNAFSYMLRYASYKNVGKITLGLLAFFVLFCWFTWRERTDSDLNHAYFLGTYDNADSTEVFHGKGKINGFQNELSSQHSNAPESSFDIDRKPPTRGWLELSFSSSSPWQEFVGSPSGNRKKTSSGEQFSDSSDPYDVDMKDLSDDVLKATHQWQKAVENGLNCIVIGDWGIPEAEDSSKRLVEKLPRRHRTGRVAGDWAERVSARFVLNTGDAVYPHGLKSPEDRTLDRIMNSYPPSIRNRDWISTLGNHDCEGQVDSLLKYHKRNRFWDMYAPFYTREYDVPDQNGRPSGDRLQVIILDACTLVCAGPLRDHRCGDKWRVNRLSNNPELRKVRAKQMQWLNNTLEEGSAWAKSPENSNRRLWRFVSGHWPIFSFRGNGPAEALVREVRPLLIKHGVHAYFSGHDHSLQHIVEHLTGTPARRTGAGIHANGQGSGTGTGNGNSNGNGSSVDYTKPDSQPRPRSRLRAADIGVHQQEHQKEGHQQEQHQEEEDGGTKFGLSRLHVYPEPPSFNVVRKHTMHYFVSGAGGYGLHPTLKKEASEYLNSPAKLESALDSHGFLAVSISGGQLKVAFVEFLGEITYETTILYTDSD